MNYWTATAEYLKEHGEGPECPDCGKTMFPQDDHGRFTCFCSLGGGIDVVSGMRLHVFEIPQIDTSNMPNEQRAKIAPVNRLESEPTTAEADLISLLLIGPKAMDSPEYSAACEALRKERGE